MASLEGAPPERRLRKAAPAPNLVTVQGTGATAALLLEGAMMYDLDLTVLLTAAGIAMLAAVYVWSKDPDRRARAWSLLKLLLGR